MKLQEGASGPCVIYCCYLFCAPAASVSIASSDMLSTGFSFFSPFAERLVLGWLVVKPAPPQRFHLSSCCLWQGTAN